MSHAPKPLYAAIEGGGTKFICAVGTGPDELCAETTIPTTTPAETLGRAIAFFGRFPGLAALGVACFGPLDPDPGSPGYGRILATPKPGWEGADLLGILGAALGLPMGFDTDVNAAALAEARWGAGAGMDPLVYLTIGTGIGGGVLVHGRLVHGLGHPELGHVRLPAELSRAGFAGVCPFHGDCFEGLASGPSLAARWGRPAESLPETHPAWELEAQCIAHALMGVVLTLAPRRIILGGGVGSVPWLLPLVRREMAAANRGYLQWPRLTRGLDSFLVAPGLGSRSGMLGALALAMDAGGRDPGLGCHSAGDSP